MQQSISKRILTSAAVAILPLSLLLSAPAQTGGAPAAAASAEVSVDLVARDKKGNIVSDLTPADVEITASGAAAPVKNLRLAASQATDQSSLVTLVFDRMEPGNAKVARDTAFDLLKALPTSGLSFAVLKIDGRLHLLQDYTTDRETLRTAINAATVADDAVYARDNEAAEKPLAPGSVIQPGSTAQMLLAMILDSQTTARRPHTTAPVAALLAASRAQKDTHGRKVVLFFCQGLNFDVAAPEMIGEIAQEANAAGVSIYSIDAHIVDSATNAALLAANAMGGVSAAGNTGMAAGAGRIPSDTSAGGGAGTAGAQQMSRIESGGAEQTGPPLVVICRSTGGVWMVNADRAKNVRRIAADLTTYYTATFVPPNSPDRYHSLNVKALRAGVSIQARSSYASATHILTPPPSAQEAHLLEVLGAPALATDVTYHSALLRLRSTADGTLSAVVVEAPVNPGGSGPISVLAQVKDKSGQVVQKFSEDLARPAAPQDVVTFRRHFRAAPGQYTLETAVISGDGGKAGAQRQSFEVPAAADGPGLGEIVLARRIDPGENEADASNPLHCADGTVVPDLSGVVSRAAKPDITLFFDIHPDARSTDAPTLAGEVRLNGRLIATVPMGIPAVANRTSIPYLAKLPTASLRPGAYDLKMILTQGPEKAERSVTFKVE